MAAAEGVAAAPREEGSGDSAPPLAERARLVVRRAPAPGSAVADEEVGTTTSSHAIGGVRLGRSREDCRAFVCANEGARYAAARESCARAWGHKPTVEPLCANKGGSFASTRCVCTVCLPRGSILEDAKNSPVFLFCGATFSEAQPLSWPQRPRYWTSKRPKFSSNHDRRTLTASHSPILLWSSCGRRMSQSSRRAGA